MLRPKPGETSRISVRSEVLPRPTRDPSETRRACLCLGRAALVAAVAILGAPFRKIAKQIRQLDRKLSKPGILFEQQHDVIGFLMQRLIFPKSVDFVEQGRQGGEKFVALMRRFICLAHVITFTQWYDVAGMFGISKCIAASLFVVRRMFDTHDTFLITRWPSRRFHDELSIESRANLRRKGNGEVARQKGHTSFESHGRSD
jgi:hypothetical protein